MDDQEYKFEAPALDPVHVQRIKEVYYGPIIIKSEGHVKNSKVKIKDFDGQELELYECLYKIGSIESPRLMKRGYPPDAKFVSNYKFLSTFHHPVAVQLDNYYLNSESLVISLVDGTFRKWLAPKTYNDLFTPQGTMRPVIRNMAIELATLVESLLANEMAPIDLGVKDLYIKLLPDGTPKLQVLITDVRIARSTTDVERAWESVQTIVQEFFHGSQPNEATESFRTFIGIHDKNIGRLLEDFPDQWDNSRKGLFLLESCAHLSEVSGKINYHSGLTWPKRSDGPGYPQLVDDLIAHAKTKRDTVYDGNYPYDYVKLCKNSYKHYDQIPAWLQVRDLNFRPNHELINFKNQEKDIMRIF